MQGRLSPVLKKKTDLKVSKRFWPVFAAGLGLILLRLWPIQYEGIWVTEYGGWHHLIMEFLAVNMVLSVFHVGWHVDIKRQTLRGLAFTVTFLSIGVLNLLHVLSMPNMPAFITPNSLNKAVLFGYTSYLVANTCLLSGSFLPVRRITRLTRTHYLATSIFVTLLVTWLILFYEDHLPSIFNGEELVPETGRLMALIAVPLSLAVLVNLSVVYRKTHKESHQYMKLAVGMWFLSQASLVCGGSQFHVCNLICHIYRIMACGYIYYGVLPLVVRRPYTALEQAQGKLRQTRHFRSFGRMVGRLAHELKNPLAAIRASAQLSTILDDQAEREKVNRRIETEVDRLNDLITMTLEVSWERREIWDLVRIEQIVEDVCLLWAAELRRLGITSKVFVEDELPPIQGNPKLLERAVTNLVLNAVEAMPGGGQLCILAYQEAQGSAIRLEVSDTGSGIPHELRDQLFRGFITTKPNGTGMGLMITHQIITDIHRGQIWFSTVLGEGTRFFLRLPAIQPEQQTPTVLAYGKPI